MEEIKVIYIFDDLFNEFEDLIKKVLNLLSNSG